MKKKGQMYFSEVRTLTKCTAHFGSPYHCLITAEYLPRPQAQCCVLYTTRQPLGAQMLETCRWSITRTSGVGLCQRAAGGPLLRYALGRLVSWRTRRPERTRTRTRARTALLVESDRMAARVSFQLYHKAVAAAATAAAERSSPPLWRA